MRRTWILAALVFLATAGQAQTGADLLAETHRGIGTQWQCGCNTCTCLTEDCSAQMRTAIWCGGEPKISMDDRIPDGQGVDVVPVYTPVAAPRQRSVTVTFPLSLSIGDFGAYGYESPYTEIGAGIETRTKHTIFEAGATYSPTHKSTVNDGYVLGGRAAFLLRARPLFFGAGVSQTQVSNSKWSKTATRTFLAAGLDTNTWRLAVSRELPVILSRRRDPNALEGWTYSARLRMTKQIRLGATYFTSSFEQPIGSGLRQSAQGLTVTVEWVMGEHK